jgi:hypothetical protein
MHSKILFFPVRSCKYFVHNHCVKDYVWHPKAHGFMQCRVLSAWEQAEDRVWDVAERFSLTMEEALEHIGLSIAELLEPGWLCTRFRRGGLQTGLDCIFLHGHLCRQALPRCVGACVNMANIPPMTAEGMELD